MNWGREKAMTPHSSTLAWKIPWTEEPGRLQSMGSLRFGHDWVTSLSCIGGGNGNPLLCSCLENPRDGGAWWAAVYGVAQSQTRLKRLSSSSSRIEENLEKLKSLFNSAIRFNLNFNFVNTILLLFNFNMPISINWIPVILLPSWPVIIHLC